MSHDRLVHHELCFGCGRTNLFGLLMDVEESGTGQVRGRGFVKQDHQGPDRGTAHDGIVAAALSEAMALACGPEMRASKLELTLIGGVPVGVFLDVQAQAGESTGAGTEANATAHVEERPVATARGLYTRR